MLGSVNIWEFSSLAALFYWDYAALMMQKKKVNWEKIQTI